MKILCRIGIHNWKNMCSYALFIPELGVQLSNYKNYSCKYCGINKTIAYSVDEPAAISEKDYKSLNNISPEFAPTTKPYIS